MLNQFAVLALLVFQLDFFEPIDEPELSALFELAALIDSTSALHVLVLGC